MIVRAAILVRFFAHDAGVIVAPNLDPFEEAFLVWDRVFVHPSRARVRQQCMNALETELTRYGLYGLYGLYDRLYNLCTKIKLVLAPVQSRTKAHKIPVLLLEPEPGTKLPGLAPGPVLQAGLGKSPA